MHHTRMVQGLGKGIRERCRVHTKAPIADVQVPQVYPEVVGRDECFLVGVNGDRVNMVGVCVGVDFAGYGGDDVVLHVHTR